MLQKKNLCLTNKVNKIVVTFLCFFLLVNKEAYSQAFAYQQ